MPLSMGFDNKNNKDLECPAWAHCWHQIKCVKLKAKNEKVESVCCECGQVKHSEDCIKKDSEWLKKNNYALNIVKTKK